MNMEYGSNGSRLRSSAPQLHLRLPDVRRVSLLEAHFNDDQSMYAGMNSFTSPVCR